MRKDFTQKCVPLYNQNNPDLIQLCCFLFTAPAAYRLLAFASIMCGMNILQKFWFRWNEYWANDFLAMGQCASRYRPRVCLDLTWFPAIAIICSQQIINIIRGLYRQFVGRIILAVATSHSLTTLKLPLVKNARWTQVFLNLGYAVLFPITAAFHPQVSRPNINDWTLLPSLPHLICQITVFLVIDHSSWHFFAKQFEEMFDQGACNDAEPHDGVSSALEIATDFTASTTTLILAITIIQLPLVMGYFTGGLHFAALVCWLLVRTQMETWL